MLTLGIVLGLTSVSTLAYWTDQSTLSTGTIQSGRLDLLLNNELAGQGGTLSSTAWELSNVVPGDSVAGLVTIGRASGTIGFDYTVTAADGPGTGLAPHLRWRVTNGAVTGTAPRTTCTGTVVMDSRALSSTATAVASGSLTGTTQSTTLCVEALLPATVTDPAAMGKTASAVLRVSATQKP